MKQKGKLDSTTKVLSEDSRRIKFIFLIGIITVTLFFFCFNAKSFVELSLQFYFAFIGATVALVTTIVLYRMIHKDTFQLTISTLLMLVWMIYLTIHINLISTTNDYELAYLWAGGIYFFSLSWFYRRQIVSFDSIYRLFVFVAIYQSFICILQYFECIRAMDSNYGVTGTFNNPNITAMFITLCIPGVVSASMGWYVRIYRWIVLGILILALLILQCRTAYIGLVVVLLTYLFKDSVCRARLQSLKAAIRTLLFLGAVLILCGVFGWLYFHKKSSADGRLFIWKVSAMMVQKQPIVGYGYGQFNKEYNFAQAYYLSKYNTTKSERNNARFVYMPYNDFIEQLLAGGIMGLVVFLLLICYFLYRAYRSADIRLAAIMFAISAMMTVNFILHAIPVYMLLLTVMATMTFEERVCFEFKQVKSLKVANLLVIVFVFLYGIGNYNRFKAHRLLVDISKQNLHKAKELLANSLEDAGTSSIYLNIYGKLLLEHGEWAKGCKILEQASLYSSDVMLNLDLALAYQFTGQFSKAEERLLLIGQMIPTNYKSRYRLMMLYMATNNQNKALAMARELLTLPTNFKSKDIPLFRLRAKQLIENPKGHITSVPKKRQTLFFKIHKKVQQRNFNTHIFNTHKLN